MNIDYDDEGFWVDTETGERVFPKSESEGWSVSQKEAIRERLIELCVTAIDLHEEVADSTDATEAEINKVLAGLEAITKGSEK